MHLEAKQRIVAALDAVVSAGARAPFALHLSAATARELGLHATRVDLGSESLFQDEARVHAELTHPNYDPLEGRGPGRPKADAEARALAKERCQASLRRPGAVLEVEIDETVAAGKLRVTGTQPIGHEV